MEPTTAHRLAHEWRDRIVAFCQDLIRIPSLPGQEQHIAERVMDEMRALDYDEVWSDAAGNVLGKIRGHGTGPSIMLNSHLDHVDPGEPKLWTHPPFGGVIADGRIWGRGASDIKGPMAIQVYAPAILKKAGYKLAGDMLVTAVVMEELGGVGMKVMLESGIRTDLALNGEASSNRIARGHRGVAWFTAAIHGRSSHASAPHRAINPHFSMARFIQSLETYIAPDDPSFGRSTVAPTVISTDQTSTNVIPAEAILHLDYRNIPSDTIGGISERLDGLLRKSLIGGATGEVTLMERDFLTYTGQTYRLPLVLPGFDLPADHELVTTTRRVLTPILGHEPEVSFWDFATDGGNLMAANIPTIGFSPGIEALVHTAHEHLVIDDLVENVAGHLALLPALVGICD